MKESVDFYNDAYLIGGNRGEYFLSPEKCVYYPTWSKVLELLDKEETFCDFGCGPGQLIELAIDKGYSPRYGIDFSEVAIKQAKS